MEKMKTLKFLAVSAVVLSLSGCLEESKDEKESCADRVRKEYKVPPGNVNTQNQMIQMQCEDK